MAEIALAPHRCKASGEHQGILLAQRHIEHHAQAQHHVAARLGAAGFKKAQVALRYLRRSAQCELRVAAMLAPPFQACAECFRGGHNLPGH